MSVCLCVLPFSWITWCIVTLFEFRSIFFRYKTGAGSYWYNLISIYDDVWLWLRVRLPIDIVERNVKNENVREKQKRVRRKPKAPMSCEMRYARGDSEMENTTVIRNKCRKILSLTLNSKYSPFSFRHTHNISNWNCCISLHVCTSSLSTLQLASAHALIQCWLFFYFSFSNVLCLVFAAFKPSSFESMAWRADAWHVSTILGRYIHNFFFLFFCNPLYGWKLRWCCFCNCISYPFCISDRSLACPKAIDADCVL